MAVVTRAKQFARDITARGIARLLRRVAHDPKYFELWQSYGFHITGVHYYEPIPDTRSLPASLWKRISDLAAVDMRDQQQRELLAEIVATLRKDRIAITDKGATQESREYLRNTAFEAVDAEMLYGLIRLFKPRRIYEIGSGFSTLIATDALRRNRLDGYACRFVAVEPYPSAELESTVSSDIELWRVPVQQVSLDEFESLSENDILFIDSSHVCKIGSDVQFLFLEVLPRLRVGVVVHVHDIFMPGEYPKPWVLGWHRFWNEQYLLQAFLSFNASFDVLWAGQWMHITHPHLLMEAFPSYKTDVSPVSFWLRRAR